MFNSTSFSRAVAIALRASSRVNYSLYSMCCYSWLLHRLVLQPILNVLLLYLSTCCCCFRQRAVAALINMLLLFINLLLLCGAFCCDVSLCPFDIPIAFVLFCKCEGGCPEWGKGAFYLRASAEICTL